MNSFQNFVYLRLFLLMIHCGCGISESNSDILTPAAQNYGSVEWTTNYAGLTDGNAAIPQDGGKIEVEASRSWVAGKVSHFGGPRDQGVSTSETGAITGERLRSLNPNDFYCAMRWDYKKLKKTGWAGKRILFINPKNGKSVVLRPVDWGPHRSTGRIIDVSPGALQAVGLKTDDIGFVAFATSP